MTIRLVALHLGPRTQILSVVWEEEIFFFFFDGRRRFSDTTAVTFFLSKKKTVLTCTAARNVPGMYALTSSI